MKAIGLLAVIVFSLFIPLPGQILTEKVGTNWKPGDLHEYKLEREWLSLADDGTVSRSMIKTSFRLSVEQETTSGYLLNWEFLGLDISSVTQGKAEMPGNLRHFPLLYELKVKYWTDHEGRFLTLDNFLDLYMDVQHRTDSLIAKMTPEESESRKGLQDGLESPETLEALLKEYIVAFHEVYALTLPASGNSSSPVYLQNYLGGEAYPATVNLRAAYQSTAIVEKLLMVNKEIEVNQADMNRIYRQSCWDLATKRGEVIPSVMKREFFPGSSQVVVNQNIGFPAQASFSQETWLEHELIRIHVLIQRL